MATMRKTKPQEKVYEINGLGEEDVRKVQEAFALFNKNKTDKLDLKDVKATLNALGVDRGTSMFNLITGYDSKEAPLDFSHFADRVATNISDWESRNVTDKIFDFFDTEKLGYISTDDLRKIAFELNLANQIDQIDNIVRRVSTTGKISKDDFYEILSKKNFLL